MNLLRLAVAAAALAAGTACQSKTDQSSGAGASAAAASKGAKSASTVANSPGAGYEVYRGRIEGKPDSLTLHLTFAPAAGANAAEAAAGFYGSYYSDAEGQPHALDRLRVHPDSLVLVEYLEGSAPQGEDPLAVQWRLRRQPGSGWAGTYGGNRLRLRPVRLPVGFAVRAYADSVAAYPGKAGSPYAQISLQTLLPTAGAGASAAALAALQINILRELRGDSAANQGPAPTPAGIWPQLRQQFVRSYRESVADLAAAPGDTAETPAYMLRFEDRIGVHVLCQQGNLLSLGFLNYSYAGGAHGSYATTVRSYDLRTGQPLGFDQLFRPEAQTRLLPLLERSARRFLNLDPAARLDTRLFENKMQLTKNVCLTPGGVLFVYNPYEIASYADGEIRVFVPLRELRPLLREGLPVAGGGGVAAR